MKENIKQAFLSFVIVVSLCSFIITLLVFTRSRKCNSGSVDKNLMYTNTLMKYTKSFLGVGKNTEEILDYIKYNALKLNGGANYYLFDKNIKTNLNGENVVLFEYVNFNLLDRFNIISLNKIFQFEKRINLIKMKDNQNNIYDFVFICVNGDDRYLSCLSYLQDVYC